MSTIEDLVKLIKHSRDFNEVRNLIVDREKNMRIEMENLIRDNESIRKEARLLERTQGLVELEKSELEDKLRMSQRKCEDLDEKITRLAEEQRVCNDRAKRAEERYNKVSEENFKMGREKNKTINELKKKNLESEKLVGVYEEKFKSLDSRVVIMNQEIENLKSKKMANDQMVEELKRKESEADRAVKELKLQNLEATRTVDELRLQKLESDKEAELYKSRLESLATRITQVEAALADILNVKPEDLPSAVDELDKRIAAEGVNVIFQDFWGDKDDLVNGRTQDMEDNDAEIVVMSPGVHDTCNSIRSGSIGVSKKGGGNLNQSSAMKKNAAKTVKINAGSQSGYDPRHTESKDDDLDSRRKGLQSSGPHVSVTCSNGRVPVKMASSNFTAGDIIEICDSDGETNPGGAAYVSDIGDNVGKNETVSVEFAQSRSSGQTNKRNRSESSDDSLINLNAKSKRSTCRSNEDDSLIDDNDIHLRESTHDRIGSIDAHLPQEEAGEALDSQSSQERIDPLNDDDSPDSDDESYSDEHMNNLVASLSRKSQKWMFKEDMSQAFQDNAQLCLNAVCTLYRHQLFAEKSTRCPNSFKTGGFSHFDSMGGRSLALYLINGDPELKLRKSVDEVKKERSDVLGQCKRLATTYIEKLYEIYCTGEDPFFSRT